MDTHASVLENIELFADLDADDLRSIGSHARIASVPKGGWLFLEGDPRENVYCLRDGGIKISRVSRSGQEFILELIEPGEVFGESSLFEDGLEDSFGVAFEDSTVVILPTAPVATLMQKRPELLLKMTKLLGRRKKKMESRMVTLAFEKVRGRVASLLLELCHDYGIRRSDGVRLQIRLRHQEMASLIGASREIVSHTLSDFRREGLIDSDGNKLVVRQMRPLEQI